MLDQMDEQALDDMNAKPNKLVRRPHRKSRAGCGNCKRRRIKCDEKKPICSNCTNRALECTFSLRDAAKFTTIDQPETRSRFRPYTFLHGSLRGSNEEEDQTPPTRSVDIQCNLGVPSTCYVFLDDLHLFHHFTVSTYNTLSDDAGSREIWQVHVPRWGMSFPAIQHLILAISALHLSHEFPSRQDEYVRKADDHFTFGLQSVTAVLAHLSSQTCQQVYISTVMICFVYFGRGPKAGEYLVFGDHGPSEWRVLMNGVKLIIESHRSEVFSGVLVPRSPLTAPCVGLSWEPDEMISHMEHLQKLQTWIQQELQQESDAAMYDGVIQDLVTVLTEVNEKRSIQWPTVGLMQVLMAWLYRLPDDFVDQLARKDSIPLVILAYWAMLLKYMQPVWFMKGWDVHVMGGIRASLQSQFHRWIEWPMLQLGAV